MRDQLKAVKEQKAQLEETLAAATRDGLVNDRTCTLDINNIRVTNIDLIEGSVSEPDSLADRKNEHREETSKLKDELYQLKHVKENLQSDCDNLAEQLRQKRQDGTPNLFTERELRELLAFTTARNNGKALADSIVAAIYNARKRASNVEVRDRSHIFPILQQSVIKLRAFSRLFYLGYQIVPGLTMTFRSLTTMVA